MKRVVRRSILLFCLAQLVARAAGAVADPVHLAPLRLDSSGTTPWDFSPIWFVLLSLALPAICWTFMAWKRALEEDPHRLRRAGSRELRRLLARLQRSAGTPPPADLHAWLQAAAHAWGLRVSTPTEGELNRSLSTFNSDAATRARWRDLWENAERCLYAADSALPQNWVGEATAAASEVRIPPREHWFPRRVRHWLPSVVAGVCACVLLAVPYQGLLAREDGTTENAALRDAQALALKALRADWNNWAAHYDIGAQQIVQGNMDYAVAHLTAAFLQQPASSEVQDNLRWSLQQAGSMDPTLRRLLYGAWFQRYPALLSPARWQKLALLASVLIACGLCAHVLLIYTSRRGRELRRGRRWLVAVGIALLTLSVMSWNAWGDLHRSNVAMLVEGINLSPAPTDLVKDRETLPMTAGSLTLFQASFLGWKQVQWVGVPGAKVSGWVRSPYVMPLYETD